MIRYMQYVILLLLLKITIAVGLIKKVCLFSGRSIDLFFFCDKHITVISICKRMCDVTEIIFMYPECK